MVVLEAARDAAHAFYDQVIGRPQADTTRPVLAGLWGIY